MRAVLLSLRRFAGLESFDHGLAGFIRGLLALLRACQSWAAMHGRDFVTPDDVKALSVPVLAHRIILGGLYGRSTKSEEVVREALSQIAAPVESGEGA